MFDFDDDLISPEQLAIQLDTPLVEPNFKILRYLVDPLDIFSPDYYLILQKSTKHTKWILRDEIQNKTIEEAFYDADPTFYPEGA